MNKVCFNLTAVLQPRSTEKFVYPLALPWEDVLTGEELLF